MNLRFTSKSQLEAMPIPTHVILASQSSGRRMLLEKLGIRFRVAVSRVDEDNIHGKDPVDTIKKRAIAKLDEVITHPKVYLLDEKVHNVVIAADSMAIVGKRAHGKAFDKNHAKEILKELMERTHTFVTAVAVAHLEAGKGLKKRWDKSHETKVTFRKLTPAELDLYVSRYDFTRFAAGYSVNDAPWDIVTKIDGSYTNVVGLPFEVLLPILKATGVLAMPDKSI